MSQLLDNLNPEQLAAVTLPPQHALILAGAGSGKTRVLTTRIAHILSLGRARPSEILAVTFTNKAAREMKARVRMLLVPQETGGVAQHILQDMHHVLVAVGAWELEDGKIHSISIR